MLTKREIVLPWGHPVPSWRSAVYYGRVHFGKSYLPQADEAKSGSILRKIGTLSPGGHNIMLNTSSANCLVGCSLDWNMVVSLKILDYDLKENVMSVQVSFNGILLNILGKRKQLHL